MRDNSGFPDSANILAPMTSGNLFTALAPAAAERCEVLASAPGTRVERIVSWGQASPPDFWYDQDEDEWVALLSGRARLILRDPDATVELAPGDWLRIAAHRRHRVDWTPADVATVWLAVFMRAADDPT
ncbi:MAG: cupin domain-containing protein [Anaerolineales bacterium]